MALGANLQFGTDYSIATSGVAGPGGGTGRKTCRDSLDSNCTQ